MSSEPLIDVIPLWKRPQDGAVITGWDYPSCEAIGLLKMDFLGLRKLTIIGDTIDNMQGQPGRRPRLETLALDDTATYELLSRGDTLGVFQLDGGPMRDLLRRMQPTGFEDIVAVLALYRPGPMGMNAHNDYADRKNGRQTITPIHPELEERARGHPRRDLRPDRLPGADHAHRAEGRRLQPGPSRHSAPRDGQEEEGDAREGVRGLRRGHDAPTASRRRAVRRCGT